MKKNEKSTFISVMSGILCWFLLTVVLPHFVRDYSWPINTGIVAIIGYFMIVIISIGLPYGSFCYCSQIQKMELTSLGMLVAMIISLGVMNGINSKNNDSNLQQCAVEYYIVAGADQSEGNYVLSGISTALGPFLGGVRAGLVVGVVTNECMESRRMDSRYAYCRIFSLKPCIKFHLLKNN